MSEVSLVDGHINNGMSNDEVIKIIEHCIYETCCGCKREDNEFTSSDSCRYDLLKNALDIINRQKAEIEKYRHIEQTVKDFWGELKKLSAFKNLQEPTLTELLEYIDYANSEAIKEFAEKLKMIYFGGGKDAHIRISIDNLVKEMTESK